MSAASRAADIREAVTNLRAPGRLLVTVLLGFAGVAAATSIASFASGTEGTGEIGTVSETQLQADTHVSNAGRMLEESGVERSLTKYGHARSWRRNRLIADGFALDAYGLDAAARKNRP